MHCLGVCGLLRSNTGRAHRTTHNLDRNKKKTRTCTHTIQSQFSAASILRIAGTTAQLRNNSLRSIVRLRICGWSSLRVFARNCVAVAVHDRLKSVRIQVCACTRFSILLCVAGCRSSDATWPQSSAHKLKLKLCAHRRYTITTTILLPLFMHCMRVCTFKRTCVPAIKRQYLWAACAQKSSKHRRKTRRRMPQDDDDNDGDGAAPLCGIGF